MSFEAYMLALIALATQLMILGTAILGFQKAAHKVGELKISLNSRLDELIGAVKMASFAAGKAEGINEERRSHHGDRSE